MLFRSIETHKLLSQAHTEIGRLRAEHQRTTEELAATKYKLMVSQQLQLRTESELIEVKFKLEAAPQQQVNSDSKFTYVQREPELSREVNCSQTTELGIPPDLAEPTSPQPLHQLWSPLHSQGPSYGDLDKIARNINYFEPTPDGSNAIHGYLKDIDYFLRRFPNATVEDRIYLIKRTSSWEVSSFIERQPNSVRSHYDVLCQALIEEFSNHLAQTGLVAALTVKIGRASCRERVLRLV